MPSGLIALLDDVATIAKLAATSLDDVAGAAGEATTKATGVVIDDTAVTPRYVIGLAPERELPIIGKIAWGSLRAGRDTSSGGSAADRLCAFPRNAVADDRQRLSGLRGDRKMSRNCSTNMSTDQLADAVDDPLELGMQVKGASH
jgi:hypothetical protein